MKKWIAAISAVVLAFTGSAAAVPAVTAAAEESATSTYNYGEALQKSMFFYEVQQSGVKPDWNEVSWRADCMTNDYVPGGWFDAGDHLKFTLTNAYSAALLGWGLLEYGDGVEKAGQRTMYENNLQFALDYLVGCDRGSDIVYMIGDGSFDHVWWGSAEVYMAKYELMKGETERPYYTCEDSAIQADMAAALCTGYLNFKDSKPEKAAEYLEHAIDLFDRADKLRAIGDDAAEQPYYKITTFYDDLFYAANWLYMATGEQKYLDLCKNDYISNLGKEEQSSELKYTWGMCWDDVMQGGVLLYAINTGDSQWKDQFTKHLEYWTTGYGGKQITYTPDGLPWLFQWGSLRHATTTAFLAYVAVDELYQDDLAKTTKYTQFANRVMNYCFGDNSDHFSYVIGMGDDYPQAWHHRTSSGAWNDKWSNIGQTEGEDAKPHAHILYGALVGGPNEDGTYTDDRQNYINNEVACDYNAGFTALLCKMNTVSDSKPDPNFPEPEQRDQEFYVETKLKSSDSGVTLSFKFTNHSAWPARIEDNMSYRYYMDLSEVISAGYQPSDVAVRVDRDQAKMYDDCKPAEISPITQYQGNIYYIEITYPDGRAAMPISEGQHQCELLLALVFPDYQSGWDASNDYSNADLLKNAGEYVISDRIPLYQNGVLYSGVEPDGTKPSTTTAVTTKPTPSTTTAASGSLGDVNTDGSVKLNDLVLLGRYLLGNAKLSRRGAANADLNQDGKANGMDHAALRQMLAQS